MPFNSLLRLQPDRRLPISVSARCSTCFSPLMRMQKDGFIPADKRIDTVYVSAAEKQFGYRCVNKSCPDKANFSTLRCMMEHRNLDIVSLNIQLGDELYLLPNGQPDLDHPGMEKYLNLTYGPLRPCEGFLDWEGSSELDGAQWLKCGECKSTYKVYLFATYSFGKLNHYYNDYEFLVGKDLLKIRKKPLIKDQVSTTPIPTDWLLFISEIKNQNEIIFTL